MTPCVIYCRYLVASNSISLNHRFRATYARCVVWRQAHSIQSAFALGGVGRCVPAPHHPFNVGGRAGGARGLLHAHMPTCFHPLPKAGRCPSLPAWLSARSFDGPHTVAPSPTMSGCDPGRPRSNPICLYRWLMEISVTHTQLKAAAFVYFSAEQPIDRPRLCMALSRYGVSDRKCIDLLTRALTDSRVFDALSAQYLSVPDDELLRALAAITSSGGIVEKSVPMSSPANATSA